VSVSIEVVEEDEVSDVVTRNQAAAINVPESAIRHSSTSIFSASPQISTLDYEVSSVVTRNQQFSSPSAPVPVSIEVVEEDEVSDVVTRNQAAALNVPESAIRQSSTSIFSASPQIATLDYEVSSVVTRNQAAVQSSTKQEPAPFTVTVSFETEVGGWSPHAMIAKSKLEAASTATVPAVAVAAAVVVAEVAAEASEGWEVPYPSYVSETPTLESPAVRLRKTASDYTYDRTTDRVSFSAGSSDKKATDTITSTKAGSGYGIAARVVRPVVAKPVAVKAQQWFGVRPPVASSSSAAAPVPATITNTDTSSSSEIFKTIASTVTPSVDNSAMATTAVAVEKVVSPSETAVVPPPAKVRSPVSRALRSLAKGLVLIVGTPLMLVQRLVGMAWNSVARLAKFCKAWLTDRKDSLDSAKL
jgi:hypothetical protein